MCSFLRCARYIRPFFFFFFLLRYSFPRISLYNCRFLPLCAGSVLSYNWGLHLQYSPRFGLRVRSVYIYIFCAVLLIPWCKKLDFFDSVWLCWNYFVMFFFFVGYCDARQSMHSLRSGSDPLFMLCFRYCRIYQIVRVIEERNGIYIAYKSSFGKGEGKIAGGTLQKRS